MDEQKKIEGAEKEEKKVSLVSVISAAIQVPGVKVNRDEFLKDQFKKFMSSDIELIVEKGPVAAGVDRKLLWKKAQRLIKERAAVSSGASFVAGLPGGWVMAATIPADMLQFYGVALRLAQEIAYLYGEADLWCDGTPDGDKVTNQLILYCGVMLGASGASQTVRVMSSALAKQALKKLPQKALTKTLYYPVVKSIAKFFGVKMTKEIFAKGISKVVPIVGGVVSGGITLASMIPMGNRLLKTLDKAHFDYSDIDLEADLNKIAEVCEKEAKSDFELSKEDVLIIESEGAEPLVGDDFENEEDEANFENNDEFDIEEDQLENTQLSHTDDNEKLSEQKDETVIEAEKTTNKEDVFEQIRKAKMLLDEGLLTEEEFDLIKKKLISLM